MWKTILKWVPVPTIVEGLSEMLGSWVASTIKNPSATEVRVIEQVAGSLESMAAKVRAALLDYKMRRGEL